MTIEASGELPLVDEHDIVMCRQNVRRMTQELRFSLVDQTKMVTAASELARNAVIHGGGGAVTWELLNQSERRGLRLRFVDHGQGIPNLELAMTDGWSTRGGLGMGLSGARRLVNEFEIDSAVGAGTRVSITRWK